MSSSQSTFKAKSIDNYNAIRIERHDFKNNTEIEFYKDGNC